MSERATSRNSAEAAAEAVKAYVRMNRARLAADGELLGLLLPERFQSSAVRDLQSFVIEQLTSENAALRAERDGLRGVRAQAVRLGDGVRRATLDLIDARSFEEVIAVATASADAFDADFAALCVEGEDGSSPTGSKGVRLIAPGTITAVLGREGMGAILSGGGDVLLGPVGAECRSLAAFRLKIGRETPAALYVIGANAEGRFESEQAEADLAFFARALERAIRAWLDLPKG
ncbi:MAG: DUF484 family protein [Rhizomicrobium sp.]|jgi:uncharacterized protein YigA (DUF484 family)